MRVGDRLDAAATDLNSLARRPVDMRGGRLDAATTTPPEGKAMIVPRERRWRAR